MGAMDTARAVRIPRSSGARGAALLVAAMAAALCSPVMASYTKQIGARCVVAPDTFTQSGLDPCTAYFYKIYAFETGYSPAPSMEAWAVTRGPGVPVLATISDLWPMANDSGAYSLVGKTVTGVVGNAFWIEEEDRSSAIKVVYNGTMPARNTKVDVVGTLDASSGQRVLNASSVTGKGPATPIKPLGVVEKSAGGAGVNADTPSISNGKGLYNVGMLVRIAGSVTASDSSDPNNKFFYLDDGSGLMDGTIPGIRVLCGTITPPTSGTKTVTGLVGVVDGKPVLVIRGAGDIQ